MTEEQEAGELEIRQMIDYSGQPDSNGEELVMDQVVRNRSNAGTEQVTRYAKVRREEPGEEKPPR